MILPRRPVHRGVGRSDGHAVVVRGGPPGAIAADRLGRRVRSALLVDKNRLPRAKACAVCRSGRVLHVLKQFGITRSLARHPAAFLRTLALRCSASSSSLARVALREGRGTGRDVLDSDLPASAVHAGADYLPETSAVVVSRQADTRERSVLLGDGPRGREVRTRVLVADVLGRTSLRYTPRSGPTDSERFGFRATLPQCPEALPSGWFRMALDPYVSVVRPPGNRLNIAARFLSSNEMVGYHRDDIRYLGTDRWLARVVRGRTRLLRRRLIGGDRWEREYRHKIGKKQRVCQVLVRLFRHSPAVRTILYALDRNPTTTEPSVARLHYESIER